MVKNIGEERVIKAKCYSYFLPVKPNLSGSLGYKGLTNEFEVDCKGIAWVEVEGVPFKLWTNNTFTRIAEKWGKLLDVDDQDETCGIHGGFYLKMCIKVGTCYGFNNGRSHSEILEELNGTQGEERRL
ncbi:nucleotide-binding alpha-beta plait domain-containing protein [Tanacetum coccineum]|uniref:Nucleotide-binding alpha-beta plait domain-containing protein n=1 Tax=Tanacetum coccineum TaxID=301880 RepID=A0ABQ5IAN2_9ASTR